MALSIHSIYSRKLGVDRSGYVTGETGIKFPAAYFGPQGSEVAQYGSTSVQTLTSGTTATQITAGGHTTINSSNALTWIMAPPVTGAFKTISVQSSAASGAVTVRLSTTVSGNFTSTAGSSFQAFTLLAAGQQVSLRAMSTSLWLVLTDTSSAASGGLTT